jgi:hypothetical protein
MVIRFLSKQEFIWDFLLIKETAKAQSYKEMQKEEYNRISKIILNKAIEFHREIGPGLFESIYEVCLIKELLKNNISAISQVEIPIIY